MMLSLGFCLRGNSMVSCHVSFVLKRYHTGVGRSRDTAKLKLPIGVFDLPSALVMREAFARGGLTILAAKCRKALVHFATQLCA